MKDDFTGSLVAMITYDVKIMNESYLLIINLSYDAKLLLLSDTEWFNNSIKEQGLENVEPAGSPTLTHSEGLSYCAVNISILLFKMK